MRYCCRLRVACYGVRVVKKDYFQLTTRNAQHDWFRIESYPVKKIIKILPLICCTAFFLFSFGDSMAESNIASQNSSATASLNFKIHIPAALYLQIGTIKKKQDEDASAVNPAIKTKPVSQDKKNSTVKTSGLLTKGAIFFLSSDSNNFTNGLYSKTTYYILSSPWFF